MKNKEIYIENRFRPMKAEVERAIGRKVSYREISRATGISPTTLTRLANQRGTTISLQGTVAPLIAYFRALGANVTVDEFFTCPSAFMRLQRRFEARMVECWGCGELKPDPGLGEMPPGWDVAYVGDDERCFCEGCKAVDEMLGRDNG